MEQALHCEEDLFQVMLCMDTNCIGCVRMRTEGGGFMKKNCYVIGIMRINKGLWQEEEEKHKKLPINDSKAK